MSDDVVTGQQGIPAAHVSDAPGSWVEIGYGEHDWHRPDPGKNLRCRHCGLYDAVWTGDPCPENPTRQRLHQVGPWVPFDGAAEPPAAG